MHFSATQKLHRPVIPERVQVVIPERVQVVKRFLLELLFLFFPSPNVRSAPKLEASFLNVTVVAR
jgi:hypothetical protein